MNNKKYVLVSLLFITLIGCSHKNPLHNQNKDLLSRALVSASQSAEKEINQYKAPGGDLYGQCMKGLEDEKTCDQLYDHMMVYLKNKKEYKTLSKKDLTEGVFWNDINDFYERAVFETFE